MNKFVFSGHDSFQCKTQWLKKGFDFTKEQNNFNDSDAVIKLGVGKNMVSAIRHWLRAFDIIDSENNITDIGNYIFDNETGVDPYTEDLSTLWILHYHLIRRNFATIYKLVFVDFHKEKNEFKKTHLQHFIKRRFIEEGINNLYNENTVKRDIDCFIQNYVAPDNKVFDDYGVLLLQLDLIYKTDKGEKGDKINYAFNYNNKEKVNPYVFLYAILNEKTSNSIEFDFLLELSLMFCLSTNELLELIEEICQIFKNKIVFSNVAGIKELQFKEEIRAFDVLNSYYKK